uniref:Cadherin domain-containing protein n=1 Tax=Rhodnius prolixus TaxID=13249 RepID=T1I620_RHOPR
MVEVRVLDKNDSPPSFEGAQTEFSVSEEVGVGETVGQVRAIDPDSLGGTVYTLVSGGDGKLVVSEDGRISLAESLDREAEDTYLLGIRASDGSQASHALITVHN